MYIRGTIFADRRLIVTALVFSGLSVAYGAGICDGRKVLGCSGSPFCVHAVRLILYAAYPLSSGSGPSCCAFRASPSLSV